MQTRSRGAEEEYWTNGTRVLASPSIRLQNQQAKSYSENPLYSITAFLDLPKLATHCTGKLALQVNTYRPVPRPSLYDIPFVDGRGWLQTKSCLILPSLTPKSCA